MPFRNRIKEALASGESYMLPPKPAEKFTISYGKQGGSGGMHLAVYEVVPETPCIRVRVYETAPSAGRFEERKTFIPPRNRALQGPGSFINLFLERDARPGHDTNVPAKSLIQIEPAAPAVTEKV
jgi:hypothetical protein